MKKPNKTLDPKKDFTAYYNFLLKNSEMARVSVAKYSKGMITFCELLGQLDICYAELREQYEIGLF